MRKTPGVTVMVCTLAMTQVCAARKNPPADRTVTVKLPPAPRQKQIQGDDRVLHALDRLTFGPRPGELDQVKAMGLDVWIKTPEDFVISAVRAGGINVDDANVVVKAIADLGQPLYGRPTPDGYSMLSTPWVNSSALLERMNSRSRWRAIG